MTTTTTTTTTTDEAADVAPAITNPLASMAPPLARMTKADKRNAALNALAALAGLVDLAPDENAMRKIARDEADRIRPTRVLITSPLGVRDLGERLMHPAFPEVAAAASAGLCPMLFGPAGSGKTTLAEMTADALGLPFYFSGAIMKGHQLTGYIDARGALVRTAFREAFENGGLFLFDEIDASAPQALLTVNAALSNGFCDFPDGRVKANPNFRFIGAANTRGTGASREYCGRNQLDGASLDRFGVLFEIAYDDAFTARIVAGLSMDPAQRALALEWARRVSDYRAAMDELGLRGIISPRAAIAGARMIAAGLTDFARLDALIILARFDSEDDRKRLAKAAKARVAERQKAEAEAAAATRAQGSENPTA